MNLSDLFQYGNKNTENHSTEVTRPQTVRPQAAVSSSGAAQKGITLTAGQTIHGEILSQNGNEIQIRLNKDVVISARLEKGLNVSTGQDMTFEVKNSSGSQIALRPLYENLAQDPNVLRALEAARLPASTELMRMVSSMMEQGMSIDKNSILEMNHLLTTNPGAAPEVIVSLKNMQFPVTPENIAQFESYSNYEHQLLNGVKDILSGLSETFQTMVQEGKTDEAVRLYMQVLELFTGMKGETNTNLTGAANPSGQHLFTDIAGQIPANGPSQAQSEMITAQTPGSITAQTPGSITAETPGSITAETPGSITAQISGSITAQMGSMDVPDMAQEKGNLSGNQTVLNLLGADGVQTLNSLLREIGFLPDALSHIANGDTGAQQLLQEIARILSGSDKIDHTARTELFTSKEYGQLLDSEILRQWLLKPQDVAQKGNVEEFYSKLREQTAKLTEALGQIAKDTPLAKSLTSVQNNIEFMNQLNQICQYVQLPLKMSSGEAHGDLYVYTNKKNSPNEDGSVSALLHLDMEHLGTVDVYVTMTGKNVATKFYLKDESMIDFIGAHISILDEHLTRRGYSLETEMLLSGQPQPVNAIDAITEEGKNNKLISHYSFDARA